MLDKLVISKKSSGESRKLRHLLLSTFVLVTSILSLALVHSLFSQSLAMGQENLNISTLIAPPTIPQEVPPEIQKNKVRDKGQAAKAIVRRFNIQRVDEPPVKTPAKISTRKSKYKARPNSAFILGDRDSKDSATSIPRTEGQRCTVDCTGSSVLDQGPKNTVKNAPVTKKVTIAKPPPIRKPVRKPIIKSMGVINGKAIKLAKPGYPPAARAMRISGKVTVQVMISERGNVISASPINGHPLLRRPAVIAARASKFTPTTLSKVPVKVRGLIVYNFRP